jgi:hypothetical protein
VIGWVIGGSYRDLILLHEIDDPLHALGPSALVLRAIIQIDHERGNLREPVADRFPPLCEAIDKTVTGYFRGDAVHEECHERGQEDAHGGHSGHRLKIVVGSIDLHAVLPAASEGADFDRRFGGHRNPQHIVRAIGGVIDLGHRVEDGVGFRDFFCG